MARQPGNNRREEAFNRRRQERIEQRQFASVGLSNREMRRQERAQGSYWSVDTERVFPEEMRVAVGEVFQQAAAAFGWSVTEATRRLEQLSASLWNTPTQKVSNTVIVEARNPGEAWVKIDPRKIITVGNVLVADTDLTELRVLPDDCGEVRNLRGPLATARPGERGCVAEFLVISIAAEHYAVFDAVREDTDDPELMRSFYEQVVEQALNDYLVSRASAGVLRLMDLIRPEHLKRIDVRVMQHDGTSVRETMMTDQFNAWLEVDQKYSAFSVPRQINDETFGQRFFMTYPESYQSVSDVMHLMAGQIADAIRNQTFYNNDNMRAELFRRWRAALMPLANKSQPEQDSLAIRLFSYRFGEDTGQYFIRWMSDRFRSLANRLPPSGELPTVEVYRRGELPLNHASPLDFTTPRTISANLLNYTEQLSPLGVDIEIFQQAVEINLSISNDERLNCEDTVCSLEFINKHKTTIKRLKISMSAVLLTAIHGGMGLGPNDIEFTSLGTVEQHVMVRVPKWKLYYTLNPGFAPLIPQLIAIIKLPTLDFMEGLIRGERRYVDDAPWMTAQRNVWWHRWFAMFDKDELLTILAKDDMDDLFKEAYGGLTLLDLYDLRARKMEIDEPVRAPGFTRARRMLDL